MNSNKVIKVLDLFAGTQSVKKALTEKYEIEGWVLQPSGIWWGYDEVQFHTYGFHCIEYVGLDVYSPEEQNIIIDLTSDFTLEMILNRLGNWKPDFIWASPVCNKFSNTLAVNDGSGNFYFEVNKEEGTIKPRENWNVNTLPHMRARMGTQSAKDDAVIAIKMFENTKLIIDHFAVPFAIENPRTALSKHILKDYVFNFTNYCMYGYGEFTKKPTTIYSSKVLNLRLCKHKGKHPVTIQGKKTRGDNRSVGGYATRSKVPAKLIKSIIEQLLEVEDE